MRRRLAASVAIGAVAAVFIAPASALASFHLIQVREVYPGSTTTSLNADYVVLQMFAGGQEFVGGHKVQVYDDKGVPLGAASAFPGKVAQGGSQSTILLATPEAQAQFGVTADLALNGALNPVGGAVCWDNLDCVSWGNFSKPELLPSPPGAPAAAIPDGSALQRTIARGCATALDPADDQDNSAADFAVAPPAPRPNSVAPTEKACSGGGGGGGGTGGGGGKGDPEGAPQTTLKGKPAKRTSDRTPTFRFSSNDKAAKYQCKVDRKAFRGCRSPFSTKQLSFGPHTFKVRAIGHHGDRDNSPAVYRFTVIRPGS